MRLGTKFPVTLGSPFRGRRKRDDRSKARILILPFPWSFQKRPEASRTSNLELQGKPVCLTPMGLGCLADGLGWGKCWVLPIGSLRVFPRAPEGLGCPGVLLPADEGLKCSPAPALSEGRLSPKASPRGFPDRIASLFPRTLGPLFRGRRRRGGRSQTQVPSPPSAGRRGDSPPSRTSVLEPEDTPVCRRTPKGPGCPTAGLSEWETWVQSKVGGQLMSRAPEGLGRPGL